jgi:probable rRNA maturation factor
MEPFFLISHADHKKIGPTDLGLLQKVYQSQFNLNGGKVELSIISEEEITSLNKEYRGVEEATDVLSFPTFQNLGEIEKVPKEIDFLLGSILICPAKAYIYNESLIQLTHHGLLHLLGFDHETDLDSWNRTEQLLISQLKEVGLIIPSLVTE